MFSRRFAPFCDSVLRRMYNFVNKKHFADTTVHTAKHTLASCFRVSAFPVIGNGPNKLEL